MITMVGLFPGALLISGMGVHTLPLALFVSLTGFAAAGAM